MEELQRHTEQSNAGAHSICGRPEAVKGQGLQEGGLWQELKSTVSDFVKRPAIML
jgi:hypothetical protein